MKKLKTYNGKLVLKDDIQHAFSVVKAIFKNNGHECKTTLTNANTKAENINRLMSLIQEYADKICLEKIDKNKEFVTRKMEEHYKRGMDTLLGIEREKMARHFWIATGIVFALGFTIGKMM